MPTGEHCWKKNSGASWARTSNLWIPSLTRSPLRYLGRYVKWDLNTVLYIAKAIPVSMLTLAQRRQWVVRLAFGWGWFYNAEPTLGQLILSTLSEDV